MSEKSISSATSESGDKITITKSEGDLFIQAVTLGMAGQGSYCVEKNGKTVYSTHDRDDAIDEAAKLSKE